MKSSQKLIIMGLCNLTFTSMMLAVILVESRPNLSIKKQKRAVPIVVDRPTFTLDEQDTKRWSTDNESQNWTTTQNVGQDWMGDKNGWISRSEAIRRLLDVLGLKVPKNSTEFSAREKIKKPPKYMTDLYKAIADDNGITRDPGLLHADTVRSIPNRGPPQSNLCKFDVGALGDTEVVLDAELHVFQSLRFRQKFAGLQSTPATSRIISFIKVYQILSNTGNLGVQKKLIAARRVYMHHSGWHVFSVLSTVKEWISSESTNHGLVTEMIASDGQIIENSPERDSLQPILVVFTNYAEPMHTENVADPASSQADQRNLRNSSGEEKLQNSHERSKRSTNQYRNPPHRHDGRQNARERNLKENHYFAAGQSARGRSDNEMAKVPESEHHFRYNGMKRQKYSDALTYHGRPTEADEYEYTGRDRNFQDPNYISDSSDERSNGEYEHSKRISSFTYNSDPTRIMRNCRRYPLYVNFEDMGWSGWIIHPQGYNAYHCKGVCQFPLGQHLNPTNHATVQSIMHTMGLGDQVVNMPCCAPDKLYDINLLYFDQNDYVVLRRYKDMVATSCSCR